MSDVHMKNDPWDAPFHYCRFNKAEEQLSRLRELDIGIELMLEDTRILWPDMLLGDILPVVDLLKETGIPTRLHGPFQNLTLGAKDEHIRQYSRDLIMRGLQIAHMVGSPFMVMHAGYNPQYSPASAKGWWKCFSEEFPSVLMEAQECGVMLLVENTYESEPSFFERLFETYNNPSLGMCLDIGHAHCYGAFPPQEWAERFREQIKHLHLSDNDGETDRHWTLGTGTVDSASVLEVFAHLDERPTITFEVPFDTLEESLAFYRKSLESVRKRKEIS
ncbi:sugar phosphate isomerase/epimerase [bacterium]|nr:sugar phosphate isomerase/epimerase [bacterium]